MHAASDPSPTVLLAEDDDQLRRLTALVLRSHGYAVLEAADGDVALGVLARNGRPVDLVVTDVFMPQMGGIGLARRFWEQHPAAPVLFLVDDGYDGLLRCAPDTARSPFLVKPCLPSELVRKVGQALRTRPVAQQAGPGL